jgi:hypothetical protein
VDLSTIPIQKLILETINSQSTVCDQFDSITGQTSSSESFYLKLRKNYRTRAKLAEFSAHRTEPHIWLGPLLRNLHLDYAQHTHLPAKFWADISFLHSMESLNDPQVVFVANNDLSGILSEQLFDLMSFFLEAENILFVVWDADNHHWSMLSTVLCLASDFYFPAHIERISYFQSLNPYVSQVVPLGSCQWSIELLEQNSELIVNSDRSDGPWGQHQFYPKFEMRNAVVKTVSELHPAVGFISSGSRLTNPLDSLKQWAGYKTHFCACVGGDMPYRVFDALITGGVAIVPSELRAYFALYGLPEDRVVYYQAADVFEINILVACALEKFECLRPSKHDFAESIRDFHITKFGHTILQRVAAYLKT